MLIIKKFKTIGILFLLGFGFIIAQEDEAFEINEAILSEFDLMSEIANGDIREAIREGIIPADIAITSFATYGFSEVEKEYFQEVMNRIFYSDVSFKLISVPDSQAIQMEEVDDKVIVKKGASKNRDLKKYADSIGSKHYGEIYIYAMTTRTYMKILVHDADTGDVVWSKNWSVKRDNPFTAEIGYSFGFSLSTLYVYHALHTFFGSRAIGLGEFGVSVDLGAFHQLSLIASSEEQGLTAEGNLGDIGVSLLFSPKVSLNIIELAKASYAGIDVYGIIKPGLRVELLILTDTVMGSGDPLYLPRFYFSGNVGLGVGFKQINIDLLFDVNPKGGLMASLSLYYKF